MSRQVFWAIAVGILLAIFFFGFVKPIMDKNNFCLQHPTATQCSEPHRRP